MNLPNKLTVLRVIMVPFFVFFMLTDVGGAANKWIALIIFCVASLTDMLDGKIARARNLVTNFGKFMDPLADKLLVTSAMLWFVEVGQMAAWVLLIVIAREFAVSGLRMVAAGAPGGKVIAAKMWGKVKTVLQMLTLIFYYFGYAIEQAVSTGATSVYTTQVISFVLCWIVAAVTLISGAKYLWDNRSFINTAK